MDFPEFGMDVGRKLRYFFIYNKGFSENHRTEIESVFVQ